MPPHWAESLSWGRGTVYCVLCSCGCQVCDRPAVARERLHALDVGHSLCTDLSNACCSTGQCCQWCRRKKYQQRCIRNRQSVQRSLRAQRTWPVQWTPGGHVAFQYLGSRSTSSAVLELGTLNQP